MFIRAEVPSARDLLAPVWRSGWARAWSCRNSLRSARLSIMKGPLGGGPEARVLGKRS